MKEKQMYPWKWNIQTKRYIASCCREPAREDRGAEAEAGDCAVLFANAAIIILLSLPDLFTMPASFPKEEPGDFFYGKKGAERDHKQMDLWYQQPFWLGGFFYVSYRNCFTLMQIWVINA